MDTRTAALLASVVAPPRTVGSRVQRLRRPLVLVLSGLVAALALTAVPSPVDAATGAPLAWGARNHVDGIDSFSAYGLGGRP
jgi:hypothetical protein